MADFNLSEILSQKELNKKKLEKLLRELVFHTGRNALIGYPVELLDKHGSSEEDILVLVLKCSKSVSGDVSSYMRAASEGKKASSVIPEEAVADSLESAEDINHQSVDRVNDEAEIAINNVDEERGNEQINKTSGDDFDKEKERENANDQVIKSNEVVENTDVEENSLQNDALLADDNGMKDSKSKSSVDHDLLEENSVKDNEVDKSGKNTDEKEIASSNNVLHYEDSGTNDLTDIKSQTLVNSDLTENIGSHFKKSEMIIEEEEEVVLNENEVEETGLSDQVPTIVDKVNDESISTNESDESISTFEKVDEEDPKNESQSGQTLGEGNINSITSSELDDINPNSDGTNQQDLEKPPKKLMTQIAEEAADIIGRRGIHNPIDEDEETQNSNFYEREKETILETENTNPNEFINVEEQKIDTEIEEHEKIKGNADSEKSRTDIPEDIDQVRENDLVDDEEAENFSISSIGSDDEGETENQHKGTASKLIASDIHLINEATFDDNDISSSPENKQVTQENNSHVNDDIWDSKPTNDGRISRNKSSKNDSGDLPDLTDTERAYINEGKTFHGRQCRRRRIRRIREEEGEYLDTNEVIARIRQKTATLLERQGKLMSRINYY